MYKELKVNIGATEKKVFFQIEDKAFDNIPSSLHSHYYPEILMLARGKASFEIDGSIYHLSAGDLLAIPQNKLHACVGTAAHNSYISFFIYGYIENITRLQTSPFLIENFINEFYFSQGTNNYSKVVSYISFLCNDLYKNEKVLINEMIDYPFIIEEFISRYYADNITLSDLASELHLSTKQTERLLLKHTGKTFKGKIREQRMKIAEILLKNKKMTKKEIAEYVGYDSYSGYWKAFNKTNTEI